MIGKLVNAVLIRIDLTDQNRIIFRKDTAALFKIRNCDIAHGSNRLHRFGYGHRRRNIQLFVQGVQFRMQVLGGLVILDDDHGQLHQPIGKGYKYHSSQQIKHGLEVGDASAVHGTDPESRSKSRQLLQQGHDHHEQNGTDGIKGNMDHTGSLGIPG